MIALSTQGLDFVMMAAGGVREWLSAVGKSKAHHCPHRGHNHSLRLDRVTPWGAGAGAGGGLLSWRYVILRVSYGS